MVYLEKSKKGFNMFGKRIALALTAALGIVFNANAQTLDTTAAVVNNDIILTSELDAMQKEMARNFASRGQKVSPVTARKAALEQLITKSLILQQAKSHGLNLNDMQLDQALAQFAARNGVSVKTLLNQMGPGLNEAAQRERFREDLIIGEVRRNQVRNRIKISDSEVKLLAKNLKELGSVEPSYHLSQLIVPLSAKATPAQIQRAVNTVDKIKADLRKGADFNDLAARYTQGSLAAQGGDLGFIPESRVPVPFLPSLLKSKPGAIIGPIRSPYGLHLIKYVGVTDGAVKTITMYDASHILLTTSIVYPDATAVKELNLLRDEILKGSISFADAAKNFSEDPGSAINGGDLGYATPDRYDPAFAAAMVRLKPGEISEPIRSSFGYHLIKLNDIKTDLDSDASYEDQARNLIFERLFREESVAWERELRDTAYIHVSDPALLNAGINIDQEQNNPSNNG